jgi:hypothetical protein
MWRHVTGWVIPDDLKRNGGMPTIEDEGTVIVWNDRNHSPNTVSHPKRLKLSGSCQISKWEWRNKGQKCFRLALSIMKVSFLRKHVLHQWVTACKCDRMDHPYLPLEVREMVAQNIPLYHRIKNKHLNLNIDWGIYNCGMYRVYRNVLARVANAWNWLITVTSYADNYK